MGKGSRRTNIGITVREGKLLDGAGGLQIQCPMEGSLLATEVSAKAQVGVQGDLLAQDGFAILMGDRGLIAKSSSAQSKRLATCIARGNIYRGELTKTSDGFGIRFWEIV